MVDIYIMVIGSQTEIDKTGIILDFVKTEQEAEGKIDYYHENYIYVEFVECIRESNAYLYEGNEYNIGDKFYF
jgi:hypothetical protein